MKLVRHGRNGRASRSLEHRSRCHRGRTFAGRAQLRGVNVERLPRVRGRPRLGCPLAAIGKRVCIGLNYSDRAREVGRPAPAEPTVFIKANSALNGPYDAIVRPRGAVKTA